MSDGSVGIPRAAYRNLRRSADRMVYRLRRIKARLHTKYFADVLFVHINKTAGSSIEQALEIPFQHLTAQELRDLVGPDRWEARFSFAFVRNPWDKVASHYHFRRKTDQTGLADGHLGFNEWVVRAYGHRDPQYYDQPKMFMPQVDWLSDNSGDIIVDFIGRFERLEEDFARLCEAIDATTKLPHYKASSRPPYEELYNKEAASIVRNRFRKDIVRFGYEY